MIIYSFFFFSQHSANTTGEKSETEKWGFGVYGQAADKCRQRTQPAYQLELVESAHTCPLSSILD